MKKYKIGYTTGVFDMFHLGHLNIIKRSKELCDNLIVGVSIDELVYSYKGKHPIIPFKERFEIVEAIKYVDKVIPQESMDKLIAWETIRFDVLFHGDDWKNSKLYKDYKRKFNPIGVELVFFPCTKGTTSSKLQKYLDRELLTSI